MEQNNHLTNFITALQTEQDTKEKNHLTYVSWANAWKEFKKIYPLATYEVVKFDGVPYQDLKDRGTMVFTRITADGITYEMWLPVMDYSNKIVKTPDLIAINKTIMRCLTKNIAMFGIGLYVYAGEDLPEVANDTLPEVKKTVAPIQRVTPVSKEPAILPKVNIIPISQPILAPKVNIIPIPPVGVEALGEKIEPKVYDRIAIVLPQTIPAGRKKLNDLLDKHINESLDKMKLADEKKALSIVESRKVGYVGATDDQQIKRLAWISGILTK